jgi:subfamily B ATP-binding cassette protein MsbA
VRYAGSNRDALEAVSLRVEPGQTVALVGSSGSGKTTLVNLLPRFVEITAGRITLDGVELRDWRLSALRRQFSFVSQDVVMFNDSIAANVTLGLPPDRERISRALEAANLGAHVAGLADGMDTVVGHNATQLSGGQRQRLAIARALYKDAPILVLDEATSALDTESEQAVKSALQRLMAGRTTLIIAHRLSTIEHADHVLVLDHGRLVEQGTHAELLALDGLYAHLHRMQFREDAVSP